MEYYTILLYTILLYATLLYTILYYSMLHYSILYSSCVTAHTGYIARQRILRCVQRAAYPGCQRADFLKLVEFVELNAPPAPEIHIPSSSSAGPHHSNLIHYFQDRELLIGPMIHYQKLFLLIGR